MSLLSRFLSGDRLALARMITYIEDRAPGYHEALARIFAHRRGAYRVGVTGPPGAGKSSLVNRLALKLANEGHQVGVVAVDPSSPFTGGALLGDRVRMQSLYGLPGVFVRSMATRGSPGGLAAATRDVCVAFEGFGFDLILVETVGVGQVELDVASVCDTVIVVFVPESGDAIQAMKSGLMEIADVFCINKADRPGAERVKAELESILEVKQEIRRSAAKSTASTPHWNPPVLTTVAVDDEGTDGLWEATQSHRRFHDAADPNGVVRRRARADLTLSLAELARLRMEDQILVAAEFEQAVEQIATAQADPYTLARRLFDAWCRSRE
ncbi:MAG: methylmalonyl Co-A mutase-associated GTPase MeaB [Candidatus Zixiibacteriota bacterium]